MSEIEIGECVRTKAGIIDKVDRAVGMIEKTVHLENSIWIDIKDIVKHSKSLIDLIEVGDVLQYKTNNLSAYKIKEVKKYKNARSFKEYLGVEGFGLEQITILNVLTKEQFTQNSYKVED